MCLLLDWGNGGGEGAKSIHLDETVNPKALCRRNALLAMRELGVDILAARSIRNPFLGGLRVQGLGLRVWGLGFGVWGGV